MGLIEDVRQAIRTLMRAPAFTALAVGMLGIAIGINVAVFSITDTILFKGFSHIADNHRIVYIDTQRNGRGCCVSYPDFEDWRSQVTVLDGLGAVADLRVTLTDADGFPQSINATQVTPNTFELLKQSPVLGRNFQASDAVPGAPMVIILTHGFWERRFGGNPATIGQSILVNGAPATVIGVMPPGFSFPKNQDFWLPLAPNADLLRRDARQLWFAFGRLVDGATLVTAEAEIAAISARLTAAYPVTNTGVVPRVRAFEHFFIGPNATTLYTSLLGAVAFVLLIVCANLANLLLARAIGRWKEMSVRVALGAGRWRVIRQVMVESMVIALLAGLVGWWMAGWSLRLYELVAQQPVWFTGVLEYHLDYRVFIYLIAISLAAGIFFGLVPALRLSRIDVNAALKDGSRGATGGKRGRYLASLLVTGEMALAIILLAAAGVLMRSFVNVHSANLGVNASNVLTMLVSLPESMYPRPESQIDFFDRLTTRLEGIPGIESVAMAWRPPTAGSQMLPYQLLGGPPTAPEQRRTVGTLGISPGYFSTLQAKIVAGREFDQRDGLTTPVVIVNERFAREHWPAEDAVGKYVRVFDQKSGPTDAAIIGVAGNIVQNDSTRQTAEPLIYLPYRQRPTASMWLFARTTVPPTTLTLACRRAIQELDANLPIWLGPFSLSDRIDEGVGTTTQFVVLFSMFAAVALLLTVIGLYAVVAHTVGQRTREIGIRMTIGASRRAVLGLVFAQGMTPVVAGLGLGLFGAITMNRLLSAQLVGVSAADPVALGLASTILLASACLGCLLPARRAMRVDPVSIVRGD